MKRFLDMLDHGDGGADMEDTAIAIRGFGRFAAPTAKYSSTNELKKVLSRLFHFSERFYQSDGCALLYYQEEPK